MQKRPLSNERKTFMEANSYTTKTKQIIIIDNNHIIHEENTEFSWKTEGQPLSGDKTVHSPLLYFSVVLARTSATGSHLD